MFSLKPIDYTAKNENTNPVGKYRWGFNRHLNLSLFSLLTGQKKAEII
jgi:hypothetical protein